MEYQVGQVVYSKNGHDKDDVQVVLSVEDDFVWVVDGKRRTLAKPKRKKMRHIQPTKYVDVCLAERIAQNDYLLDADIRKSIKVYVEKQ